MSITLLAPLTSMAPSSRSPHPAEFQAETQACLAQHLPEDMPLPDTCIVPWKQGFRLGCGVDALTGAIKPPALESFDTTSNASTKISAYIRLCESTKSVRDTFAWSSTASNSLNVEPLDLRTSLTASALSHVQHSSTSFSLVARWKSMDDMAVLTEPKAGYHLDPAAAEVLRSGAEHFRRAYGDYFVANYGSGSQFDAVLTFQCRDAERRRETLNSLRTVLDASGDSLGATKDTAAFETSFAKVSEAFSKNVTVAMDVYMHGVVCDTSGPEDLFKPSTHCANLQDATPVLRCFEWFVKHRAPLVISAELRPFFLLTGPAARAIKSTIPVAFEVFSDLDSIRQRILACAAVSTALRALSSTSRLQACIDDLIKQAAFRQQELATNHRERKRLLHEATRLERAWSLWNELLERKATEPVGVQAATRVDQQWSYGLDEPSTSSDDAIPIIEKTFKPVSAEKDWWTHRGLFSHVRTSLKLGDMELEATCAAGATARACRTGHERVVGWRITSRDGHGEWQIEKGGLGARLNDQFIFEVTSGRFETVGWQVTVYVVRDDFFDLVVSAVH